MGKKEQKAWMINFISVLVVLGIFAISCLFLINIGIQVYRNVVVANDNNFELRTSLSYVATKYRQTDTQGLLRIEEKDGVIVLVLGEEIEGTSYETLIYHRDGALHELYRESGMEYNLDYGTEVMEIATFSMSLTDEGILELTASNDMGEEDTLVLMQRSGR